LVLEDGGRLAPGPVSLAEVSGKVFAQRLRASLFQRGRSEADTFANTYLAILKEAISAIDAPAPQPNAPGDPAKKGDATLLGEDWVTVARACQYLGIKRRAVETALNKDGKLVGKGSGPNRRVSKESLLNYLPPKNTK
jgi:hypothetical protein